MLFVILAVLTQMPRPLLMNLSVQQSDVTLVVLQPAASLRMSKNILNPCIGSLNHCHHYSISTMTTRLYKKISHFYTLLTDKISLTEKCGASSWVHSWISFVVVALPVLVQEVWNVGGLTSFNIAKWLTLYITVIWWSYAACFPHY